MSSDIQQKLEIANKKIGAMLREARLNRKENIKTCADLLALSPEEYEAIEYGEQPITLPQLELITFHLDQPLESFLKHYQTTEEEPPTFLKNRATFLTLRQKMIGALLRQARIEASLSLESLAEECQISPATLEAYEFGEEPIPLPILRQLATKLNLDFQELRDQKGIIGRKQAQEERFKAFTALPEDLQHFVAQPENVPFLRAAQKMSQVPKEYFQTFLDGLNEMRK